MLHGSAWHSAVSLVHGVQSLLTNVASMVQGLLQAAEQQVLPCVYLRLCHGNRSRESTVLLLLLPKASLKSFLLAHCAIHELVLQQVDSKAASDICVLFAAHCTKLLLMCLCTACLSAFRHMAQSVLSADLIAC